MTTLSLTVLGADGTHAGPGGACTGYLVRSAEASVWLDCGPGTFANLQTHIGLEELDAIVCTHEHPDHWIELPVVRNAALYTVGVEGIPLFSTAGTLELFRAVSEQIEPPFDVTTIDESTTLRIVDQQWRFSRTEHPVETLACRVSVGDSSLLFSADTGNGWDARSLGPVDLALIEATLDEADAGTVDHLTASEAGRKAREAGAAKLIITHLAPGSDPDERRAAAEATFGGDVSLARIGDVYEA